MRPGTRGSWLVPLTPCGRRGHNGCAPEWRNGRRRGLKIPHPTGYEGSTPSSGTRLRSRRSGENGACHGVAEGEAGPLIQRDTLSRTTPWQARFVLDHRERTRACHRGRGAPAPTPVIPSEAPRRGDESTNLPRTPAGCRDREWRSLPEEIPRLAAPPLARDDRWKAKRIRLRPSACGFAQWATPSQAAVTGRLWLPASCSALRRDESP